MSKALLLTLAFLILTFPPIDAQDQYTENTLTLSEGAISPAAQIEDFDWFEGQWKGEGFGSELEEIWGPAKAGSMVATFKVINNDAPMFYEICLLAEENGSVVYKVKHFNPDLTGWETKDEYVTFPLVRMNGDTAFFDGLTYIREDYTMIVYVSLKQKDGSIAEEKLIFHHVDGPSPTALEFDALFQPVKPIPVAYLGSYHMSNPGADMFNLEADDVLAPKRQEQIMEVVESLARFKPTKIAVEARIDDTTIIARYKSFLNGDLELRKSEKEQIGFRLAKMLGHETIYPIDVKMLLNDSELGPLIESNPAKYGPYMQSLQAAGKGAMNILGRWLSEGTIGEMLYKMNDPKLEHAAHGTYFRAFVPIADNGNYAGPDMVNTWYQRNLRIFSNLHQISDSEDDRILVIYGQGHVPLFKQFTRDSPYFEAVDVREYLTPK